MQSEEQKENKTKKTKGRAGLYVLLALVLLVLLAGAAYKIFMDHSYQPTGEVALEGAGLNAENNDNLISVTSPGIIPANGKTGLVFYSALQVEPECYLPLMYQLAARGYDCYLPKAFGNQPFLNIVGADSVIRKHPNVENWYVIGHSGGCDPAASYAKEHTDTVKGLIFLGGTLKQDLSKSNLRLLSVFGSNDTVSDKAERDAAAAHAPANAAHQTIPGGNNTGFADIKGLLPGDSKADIPAEEQIRLTAEQIDAFLASVPPN